MHTHTDSLELKQRMAFIYLTCAGGARVVRFSLETGDFFMMNFFNVGSIYYAAC